MRSGYSGIKEASGRQENLHKQHGKGHFQEWSLRLRRTVLSLLGVYSTGHREASEQGCGRAVGFGKLSLVTLSVQLHYIISASVLVELTFLN